MLVSILLENVMENRNPYRNGIVIIDGRKALLGGEKTH